MSEGGKRYIDFLAGPRASRLPNPPQGSRDNLNHATINIGDVLTERPDPVRNYGPDQSDTLVIPINLGGIRGAITARFIKFPFHSSASSQPGAKDNAR